jgi:hypothetical protein
MDEFPWMPHHEQPKKPTPPPAPEKEAVIEEVVPDSVDQEEAEPVAKKTRVTKDKKAKR